MSGALHLDTGKLPLADVPRSTVEAVASVLAYGAKKYDRRNWRKGAEWTRFAASALRHLFKWLDCEDLDDESGLPHLAHAMCNLAFLVEWAKTHPELDDRYRADTALEALNRLQKANPGYRVRLEPEPMTEGQAWIAALKDWVSPCSVKAAAEPMPCPQDPTTVVAMRHLEESRAAMKRVNEEER